MAVLPTAPFIDEDMRRALGGAPLRPPGLARLPGPPSMVPPSSSAAAPAVAAPPSPPVPPPAAVDPAVGAYAARLMGENKDDAGAQAKRDLGASLQEDVALAGLPEKAPQSSGGDSDPDAFARMVDALAMGMSQHRTGRAYDPTFWQQRDDRRLMLADKRKAEGEQERAKALAALEADPMSERSMKARSPQVAMLRQLGLTDEEIAGLSAADIKDMVSGGNLATTVAKARQRAAEAKAEAEAKEAARIADEKHDEETWQAHNATTSEQAMDRARTMAGMTAGRMVDSALLADKLARDRSEEAAERRAALHEEGKTADAKRKVESELRTAEQKEADEVVALEGLEKKLLARKPTERLPGQEGYVNEAIVKGKSVVGGGTGRSSEDSRLDTDLTKIGLQSYMNTAHNAPNSEREQQVANNMFRGNGTVQSALESIRQRKREIEEVRKKRAAAAAARPAAAEVDPDEAALGIEEEP